MGVIKNTMKLLCHNTHIVLFMRQNFTRNHQSLWEYGITQFLWLQYHQAKPHCSMLDIWGVWGPCAVFQRCWATACCPLGNVKQNNLHYSGLSRFANDTRRSVWSLCRRIFQCGLQKIVQLTHLIEFFNAFEQHQPIENGSSQSLDKHVRLHIIRRQVVT